jgi:hypothetical protein
VDVKAIRFDPGTVTNSELFQIVPGTEIPSGLNSATYYSRARREQYNTYGFLAVCYKNDV